MAWISIPRREKENNVYTSVQFEFSRIPNARELKIISFESCFFKYLFNIRRFKGNT